MNKSTEISKNAELTNLESQINLALSGFKGELNEIKASVVGKEKGKEKAQDSVVGKEKGKEKAQDSELTVEKMKKNLEKNKLMIQAYVQVNGLPVSLKDLVVDEANKMYKMTYIIDLEGKSYELPSYFKIINTLNNSYLQFQIPPTKKESAVDVSLDGKVYDVNVIKEKTKDVDVRIQYNEQKTLAKILEKVTNFSLKKDFEIKKDAELENTQLTGLNKVALGKEVTKVDGGYTRSVFLNENKKYRDLGKVYFDEKGDIDVKKTQNVEFKVLEVPLTLRFDLVGNTFTIEKYENLKAKVLAHRAALKEFISNSSVADNTIFTGFNRIGSEWTNTKNIGLSLIDDTYTVQWGAKKDDVLRFGFDSAKENKPLLKDLKGAVTDSFVLPVIVDKEERLYNVKNNTELSRLNIIESTTKEHQTVQELPELLDAPVGLKAENLYVYNREDGKKLEYFTADGKLVTAVPASKTDVTNEWKLETLAQAVDPYDIFKGYLSKFPAEYLKKMNIFENDLYTLFAEAFKTSVPDLATRPVVKVSEGNGYVYYKVDQRKAGEAFIFEKDDELYEEATTIIDLLAQNLKVLETLSKTKLTKRDGDSTSDFLEFQGGKGMGLLDVSTADKLTFLASSWNDEKTLKKTLIYSNGLLPDSKDSMPLNFIIKKDKITLEGKRKNDIMLEGQTFQIRSETDEEGKFILYFDPKATTAE